MSASLMVLVVDSTAVPKDVGPKQTSIEDAARSCRGGFDELLAGLTDESAGMPAPTQEESRHVGTTLQDDAARSCRVSGESADPDASGGQLVAGEEWSRESGLSETVLKLLQTNLTPDALKGLRGDVPAQAGHGGTPMLRLTPVPTEMVLTETVTTSPILGTWETEMLPDLSRSDRDRSGGPEVVKPTGVTSASQTKTVEAWSRFIGTTPERDAAQSSLPQPTVPEDDTVTVVAKSSQPVGIGTELSRAPRDLPRSAASRHVGTVGTNPSKTLTETQSTSEETSLGAPRHDLTAFEREFEGRGRAVQQALDPVVQESSSRPVGIGTMLLRAEPTAAEGPRTSSPASVVSGSSGLNSPDEGRADVSGGSGELGTGSWTARGAEGASRSIGTATEVALDADRLMDRMVRFVRANVTHDRSSIEMRLHPPELGSIRMSMTVRTRQGHAALKLSLETTTEAARQVISHNVTQLRETLVQQGYEVARLDVSLGQTFAHPDASGQQQAQEQAFNGGRTSPLSETETPVNETTVTVPHALSRHLDVVA